jgi:hypothetical protein
LEKGYAKCPEGFVEYISSFRGLYQTINNLLKESTNTLFVLEKLDFSKKNKDKKEKIRLLIKKHNSKRNLEKRII